VANNIENDLFENNEAFYLELPDYLLRLQRRDFFRTPIPASTPVKCIIPLPQENPDDPVVIREISVRDISGGGIGLQCEEKETELLPNNVFPDCRISIPDVGILTVNIEVRNAYNVTTPNNVVHKHVGCRFYQLDNQMNILLQRYITRLQSESLAKL
jgi:c-di-GMP-binding flagellar brake protein YcgR